MMVNVICDQCGKEIIPKKHTSGYGEYEGKKLCYSCIGDIERDQISKADLGDKHLFYYEQRKTGDRTYQEFVVNWPSSLEYQIFYSKDGRHNFGGKMISVWFRDHVGHQWYGRVINPDFNQSFMAKRIKG